MGKDNNESFANTNHHVHKIRNNCYRLKQRDTTLLQAKTHKNECRKIPSVRKTEESSKIIAI